MSEELTSLIDYLINDYTLSPIDKMSTVDIIKEMTLLDQRIGLNSLRYNKLQQVLINRFPQLEGQEAFKLKEKKL